MKPLVRRLIWAAILLSAWATYGGISFWHQESAYAAAHPHSAELARALEGVGAAFAALGIAGMCFGTALLQRDR